jgi:hypothetical protein
MSSHGLLGNKFDESSKVFILNDVTEGDGVRGLGLPDGIGKRSSLRPTLVIMMSP